MYFVVSQLGLICLIVSDPLKYFMPTTTKVQPPLGHSATVDCSLAPDVNSSLVS